MKQFGYFCNTRIEMGVGKANVLPEMLHSLDVGQTVLLVTDPGVVKAGLVSPIESSLQAAGYRVSRFENIVQNPRDTDCLTGVEQFHEVHADCIVAVGGGSAIDTGKTIALCGRSGGSPSDYADGLRMYANVAPIICIPTTAGTGAEVTRSAVITESATHRKMTLKHVLLRPTLAVLDPLLTISVPKAVTAATGVDALVHAIEGYTCKITNPISQALGAKAMRTIVSALPVVFLDGQNLEARADMLEGSLLAGLCFGSADVASVHCLAEALGGLYDTPHGVANAVFLPYVLRFNAQAELGLHAEIAKYMKFANDADSDTLAVEKLIAGIEDFTKQLEIPRFCDLPGVREADFPRIVELAMQNGSTPNNVRTINEKDYREILEKAYFGEI